ncbi:HAD family hydrolase [Actinoplanes utahensis]|uniref:HAD family hydrolase n=1 Tax=Actinoplanes utahensis TaxID=1869 RepID=UPI00068DAEF6|nr:HAD family hydrolase [Actinoplanes utahensis]GIF28830.1 HAD family hydrolase [Actinoplanes utahensis]
MPHHRHGPVFFDFFGTLADYPADGREDLRRTRALLAGWGSALDSDAFHARWAACFARLEQRARTSHREYHLRDVVTSFLGDALARAPRADEIEAYIDCYIGEWRSAVHVPAAVVELVRDLGADRALAVVSNTHLETLVPDLLMAAGILDAFAAVVTSVEVGWRKPHPAIFRTACRSLGVPPDTVVFAGDTYDADYVGPTRAGMRAFLIDPAGRAAVPTNRRLGSVLDLRDRLPVR